ncbi:MAG: imidazolonepropionase [Bacteroidota bacterium]
MNLLFKNIKQLVQIRDSSVRFLKGAEMNDLPLIENAFLLFEGGLIKAYGSMEDCPENTTADVIDASGRMILPCWCDSHTHLVFAGSREKEFVDRINGLSYEEIAKRGGGILNSAKELQNTSEEELYQQSKLRLEQVMKMGTGAIEIKSGYGLTPESELKMLRVIQRLKTTYPISIKATYLAAHALPPEYKNDRQAYLKMMLDEVLPIIAKEQLADYIDVFCETNFFTVADTERTLQAGQEYDLQAKIHVNQFTAIGGVQKAVEYNAQSVDHLEVMRSEDIKALKGSNTIPVALPGCSYFLGIPYTAAREILSHNLPLALATDYNPGSAPSGNMNFAVSSACIKMKMTPEEAMNAATINGAYAMGMEKKVGSITVGKQANIILTKPIKSYAFIPYSFGENQIEQVFIKGQKID